MLMLIVKAVAVNTGHLLCIEHSSKHCARINSFSWEPGEVGTLISTLRMWNLKARVLK